MNPGGQFRIGFDYPLSFCTEVGYRRTVHCADFVLEYGPASEMEQSELSGSFRDPVLGILMLKPSFRKRDYGSRFVDMGDFRREIDFWRSLKRDVAPYISMIKPVDQGHTLIELLVSVAAVAIGEDLGAKDTMMWALESNFLLARDESLGIRYRGHNDELARRENWFMVQWDVIGLHFSPQGLVRVYEYDPSNLEATPTLLNELSIGSPEEMLHRDGYFIFIPVPGLGVLFYHGSSASRMFQRLGSADSGAVRGTLITFPGRFDAQGNPYLFNSSLLRVAVNPFWQSQFGLERIRFGDANEFGAASGSAISAPFDPGYFPSVEPSDMLVSGYFRPPTNATMSIRRANAPTEAWQIGDRQGRVRVSLTTQDDRYTPFVTGYEFAFAPQFSERPTETIFPDRLLRLEFAEDERGDVQGTCEILMEAAASRSLAERGDATFVIEHLPDGAVDWEETHVGLAVDWAIQPTVALGRFGWGYSAKCSLRGLIERFAEQHVQVGQKYDGLSVADSLNMLIAGAGLPVILDEDMPAEAKNVRIPPQDAKFPSWKHGFREGDNAADVLRTLLRMLRTQGEEWILRYDIGSRKFILEKRAAGETMWCAGPREIDQDADSHSVKFTSFDWHPKSPEANWLVLEGADVPDASGRRFVQFDRNEASLTDPEDRSFLGRSRFVRLVAKELASQEEVDRWTRILAEHIFPWRMTGWLDCVDFVRELTPNTRIEILDEGGEPLFQAYVKSKTAIYDQERGWSAMRLQIDTEWLSDL